MSTELDALIAKQTEAVAALRKRIAGVDAMMAQGQQERDALISDILKEMGKLEGMQAAAALEAKLAALQAAQKEKLET